ncbi:hypothetical protein BB560_001102 [Smittium megazygosporum]|uniref:C4-dicarboxylate transporter/malic acid transport protein n=1 Tax=Smittium megazygosporum TaxID=133381 RepID=A0A2T9ZII9_9FUNG|nr:hypothetical protein BB560_001102 [Smittium megazygosporum]
MQKGFKKIIKHFVPAWFAVTMGTGITGINIYSLPYQFKGARTIGHIFLFFNISLFIILLFCLTLKFILYPGSFHKSLSHSAQCMFFGTIPAGLATILNSLVMMFPHRAGFHFAAMVLWWIDVFLMLLCVFVVVTYMSVIHKYNFENVLATWLLPIIPAVVAAGSGAVVAGSQTGLTAKIIIIISYMIWGIGIPLSFCILAIYFSRIVLYGLPKPDIIISTMLPLGPMGQGCFGIVSLGSASYQLTSSSSTQSLRLFGETAYGGGIVVGLILWGFGFFWLVMSIISMVYTFIVTKQTRFNLGWWGLIFPLGVFISGTESLAHALDSNFFRIVGTALTLVLFVLWVMNSLLTVINSVNLSLFFDPSVNDA